MRGSQKLNQEAMEFIREKLRGKGKRDESVANTGPRWWQDPAAIRNTEMIPPRGSQLGAERMGETRQQEPRGRQLTREGDEGDRSATPAHRGMTDREAMQIVEDLRGRALGRIDQSAGQLTAAMHCIVGMRKRGELVGDTPTRGACFQLI